MKLFGFYFFDTLAFILLGPLVYWGNLSSFSAPLIITFLVSGALMFLSTVFVTRQFPEKNRVRDLFLAASIVAWLIFLGGLTRSLPLDMPGSALPLVDEGILRALPWLLGAGCLCFLAGCLAARNVKTRLAFTLQGVLFVALIVFVLLSYWTVIPIGLDDRPFGFLSFCFLPLLFLHYRLWRTPMTADLEAGIENFGIIPEEEEDFQ
jgi:hypothetical protein